MYEVTALDSKYAARHAIRRETTALPAPGARLAFSATAYCKGLETASGVAVQSGIVASDPELLPVGSVIEIDSLPGRYNGIYTVLDTGPPSRDARSTYTCGAATRRCSSGAARFTLTCCASDGIRARRHRRSSIACSSTGTGAAPVASAAAGCFAARA